MILFESIHMRPGISICTSRSCSFGSPWKYIRASLGGTFMGNIFSRGSDEGHLEQPQRPQIAWRGQKGRALQVVGDNTGDHAGYLIIN